MILSWFDCIMIAGSRFNNRCNSKSIEVFFHFLKKTKQNKKQLNHKIVDADKIGS